MKQYLAGILLAASALASAPAATAEDGAPRFGTGWFSRADRNGDGQVSGAEARGSALALFERLDTDRDGQVTAAEASDEAPRWRRERFDQRFAALDRDRDGALSRSEVALSPGHYARADQDRDGRLTPGELWHVSGPSRHGESGSALRAAFLRKDLDRDGRVTRLEATLAAERRFAHQDRDGDGVLTRGERSARPRWR